MTNMKSVALFCMVLLCSNNGATQGKTQLKRRIARGDSVSEPIFRDSSNTGSSGRSARAVSVFTPFQTQALAQTNIYRAAHCAPSLVLNASLNAVAQAYAQKLASIRQLAHSYNGYGENLWFQSTTGTMSAASVNGRISERSVSAGLSNVFLHLGSSPVLEWYSEMSQYKWTSPGFGYNTGHFTQLVWAGSQKLGMGIACTSDNKACYIVANYWPPGNYLGEFAANVRRAPCSG